MSVAFALLVVVGFALILDRLRIPHRAAAVLEESRETLLVVRSPDLTDDEKETALQGMTRSLFSHLLGILFGSFVALAVPIGLVWLVAWTGLVVFGDVLSILQRWDFILGVAVAGVLGYAVMKMRRP